MSALISVVVLSYNSSKTVLETLNSIVSQNFITCNIQLIIGDDASRDESVRIIHDWIEKNEHFFSSVLFIKQSLNIGTVKNLNAALSAVEAQWVKILAADDLLLKDGLVHLYQYVNEEKSDIVFGLAQCFYDDFSLNVIPYQDQWSFFELSAQQQLSILARYNYFPGCSAFISMSLLKRVGFFDERFKFVEDYPFWIKLLSLGIVPKLLKEVVVKYRIGDTMSNGKEHPFKKIFLSEIELAQSVITDYKSDDFFPVFNDSYVKRFLLEVKARGCDKVTIYGAGSNVNELIDGLMASGIEIEDLVDANKAGLEIKKIIIKKIDDLNFTPDRFFLINSYSYNIEIIKKIKKEYKNRFFIISCSPWGL